MVPNKLDKVWFLDAKGQVRFGTVYGVSQIFGTCTILCKETQGYENPFYDSIFATKEEAEKAKFLQDLKDPPQQLIPQGWNAW